MFQTTELTRLVKIDSARRCWRYYRVYMRSDFFAATCLVREWGRIGAQGGQQLVEPFGDADGARAALVRLVDAKKRKGYSEA